MRPVWRAAICACCSCDFIDVSLWTCSGAETLLPRYRLMLMDVGVFSRDLVMLDLQSYVASVFSMGTSFLELRCVAAGNHALGLCEQHAAHEWLHLLWYVYWALRCVTACHYDCARSPLCGKEPSSRVQHRHSLLFCRVGPRRRA